MQPTTKAATPSVQTALPMMLRIAGIWLIFVSWCQSSGWILSWLGELNAVGYLLTAPIALVVGFVFWRNTRSHDAGRFSLAKWFRRAKHSPSFLAWCVVTLLILVGAIINPPSNYDGINYRLPRLLYWLQENRWHWIDGLDHRQNISGVGHEWMSAPFILFTGSDRGLFLINFLPFLLLPGLFFVAARGLGIRLSVARWWMWVWPMAYGIALQAGSIGNDLIPAAFALASLAFASEAKRGRPALCLFFSALAAAAATGAKSTSLPLGLPLGIYWCWVAWSTLTWRDVLKVICAAIPVAIPCSVLPLAIVCIHHTGHWSGNPNNRYGAEANHPIAGIVGNSIEMVGGLIQPPIMPASKKINESLQSTLAKYEWHQWTKKNYPLHNISLGGEIPIEEHSGMGIGMTLLLALTVGARFFKKQKYACRHSSLQWALLFATSIALVAFMSKMGTSGFARLSLPYLPLLILCALFGCKRQANGNTPISFALQLIPAACLLPALILNPNRPLIPIDYLSKHSSLPVAYKQRIESVYQAYQNRSTILKPLQEKIPQADIIGFAGHGNHSALGLFKPYGSRKVINLMPSNQARADWIIGTREGLEQRIGVPLDAWNAQHEFQLVDTKNIVSLAAVGPETWFVYRRRVD